MSYQTHSNFAKVLIREQFTSCSKDLFEQLSKYDNLMNSTILNIIKRQFPNVAESMRADLAYTIKSFSKMYAELFFISNYPFELDLVCKSLVEKITILASHASIPLISKEYLSYTTTTPIVPDKEELANLLTAKKNEIADPTIQQSLDLLWKHLWHPQLPDAVVSGLVKNLQSNSHSKWTAYLYKTYMETIQ